MDTAQRTADAIRCFPLSFMLSASLAEALSSRCLEYNTMNIKAPERKVVIVVCYKMCVNIDRI